MDLEFKNQRGEILPKASEPIPKLENLGKISAATFFVPLLSALAIYGFNVAYGLAYPPKADSSQMKLGEVKAKTASNGDTSPK